MKKPWIQAAIDVEDIELAKKIAFMALDHGAEWLEVGTPLLHTYGHSAIGMLRKAVGKDITLVADYKCPYAALCVPQAAEQGTNCVMLTVGYQDSVIDRNVQICKEAGITPIFELTVRPDDITVTAEKLVQHGAEYLFSRHFTSLYGKTGVLEKIDQLPMLLPEKRNYILGITSDDLEEAQDAVRKGADWITFGFVLRKPDPEVCKFWINMIHNA
ncbi:MAG: hypothetical protein IKF49_06280 [Clostridia bacterium]|nr:hypothetical protein [Clostridia bacterium]